MENLRIDEVLEIDKDGKVRGPIMQFIGGDWLFIDYYGTTWRLKRTDSPDMPFIISKEKE